ncbi:MAG: hypothetical protein ACRD2T_07050, partial [Thermoanaerobaculia bacterium]
MPSIATAIGKKSTTVRPNSRFLRLALNAARSLAPDAAERWAARQFFTPRRRRPAARPEVPGLAPRPW